MLPVDAAHSIVPARDNASPGALPGAAPAQAVLVVDDEVRSLEALERTLEEDFTVFTAANTDEALAILRREFIAIILCDQRMPGMSGVEFLKRVRAEWPDMVRIVISGYTDAEDIIAGINEAGIWQYLLKPWHPDQLLLTLRSAGELHRLQQEHQRLSVELREGPPVLRQRVQAKRAEARQRFAADRIVRAPDSPLNAVCALAERIAPHDISVLVTGESGTGKELLARAIHYASPRRRGPLVAVNVAALPETLLESELFGHERGAFTGADREHRGRFELADGGTLFLDEIGDLPRGTQVKLLRVLQEQSFERLGGTRPIKVDVRLVAATHHDLEAMARAGDFREDLFFRLNVVAITLPPLRDRREDIPLLVDHFLRRFADEGKARSVSREAMDLLLKHDYPGNVRELENLVHRAVVLARGDVITTADRKSVV